MIADSGKMVMDNLSNGIFQLKLKILLCTVEMEVLVRTYKIFIMKRQVGAYKSFGEIICTHSWS